jgi:transposase
VHTVQLTEDEKLVLKGYFKSSPLVVIRLKSQALLMRDRGIKLADIEAVLFRDIRTIGRWVQDFSKRRLASIFTGHQSNENASKLTREQKLHIQEMLKQPPSEYGLPREFWGVPQLKEYVEATFGVVYESDQSYHYLLKFGNLSFKYPDKFDSRRNERLIVKRVEEIQEEIAPMLTDPQWEVYASDETGLYYESVIRRAWLQKGKKTVVKVNRGKEKQNYIGFLNLKTGRCDLEHLERGKQEYILPILQRYAKQHTGKRICIIWDNATFHKGKLIRQELSKGKSLEQVHLINLPPYAPDTNPIEHVWEQGKKKTANHQFENFEKTKDVFESAINSRFFNYQM